MAHWCEWDLLAGATLSILDNIIQQSLANLWFSTRKKKNSTKIIDRLWFLPYFFLSFSNTPRSLKLHDVLLSVYLYIVRTNKVNVFALKECLIGMLKCCRLSRSFIAVWMRCCLSRNSFVRFIRVMIIFFF